jgi:spermidine synthase
VAGFAFFLMELVWYRMLGPLLGGSTFTFGLILAVALVGIAVGSLAFATFRSGRAVSLPGFAAVCALEALCIALPYAIGDRLVTLTAMLQPVGSLSFLARVVEWTVVAGIVAGPASVLAGVQFPMLIALLGRGRRDVGSHTGLTYAWNTVGAIVGSLAGGFGLLPALGAPGAWKLVVTLLVTLSACALLIAARSRLHWTRLLPGAAVGAAAVALLSAVGPTAAWRHSPVGAGRVQMTASSVNDIREYARSRRHSLRWEAEGVESSVGVLADDGYAFVVNGKVDGNARGDAPTQVMLGLLGALIHGAPRDALVVGLGTGSSAGWLADVPTIERVDVVELEPAIRTVAEFCAPVNRNALANPKVHVWYGDAREAMLAGEGQFDLIASEPSNPYRAGVASLFTREFYEAAGRRLRPKGIFVQWVQAYEVDGESIRSLYATLSSVFPAVESWRTEAGDLLFVAAREPIVHDVTALRARLREEPYRSGMAWVWRVTDAEGVFGHYVGNRHLATAAVDPAAALNTDDRNGLEFAFARTVGREAGFDVEVLARAAQARQFDEPEVVHGTLDWDKVCDRRLSAWVLDGQTDFELSAGDDASRARAAAKSAYAKGDLAAARAAWFRQSEEPADLLELTLVAQSLAGTADDRAPKYAEQLAAWLPHEAEAVMAQYVWLKGRPLEALQLAERALVGYRTDPWPRPIVMRTTLAIARSIAEQDGCPPAAVAGLFEVLREPFAVALLDKERMQARLALAQVLDRAGPTRLACDVLSEFEPHTPWSLDFLRLRAATYARAGDPRTAEAQADLDAFESAEARPFVLRAADAATDAATDDGANRTGALPEPGAEPRVAQAQGK